MVNSRAHLPSFFCFVFFSVLLASCLPVVHAQTPLQTLETLGSVPASPNPGPVFFNPNDHLAYVEVLSNPPSILKLNKATVAGSFPAALDTGEVQGLLYLDSTSNVLFAARFFNSEILAINLTTGASRILTKTAVTFPDGTQQICFPFNLVGSGGSLYVSCSGALSGIGPGFLLAVSMGSGQIIGFSQLQSPGFIAADSSTGAVYLASFLDPQLWMIEAGAIVRTISLAGATGSEPRGIAVNPITHRVYVGGFSGSVSVVDGLQATLLTTIPLGNASNGDVPFALAVRPSTNHVFVTLRDAGLFVLDGATNQILATGATDSGPFSLSVDDQTGVVYVANFFSGTVSVLQDDCLDSDGDGLCDDWETNGVTVQTPSGPVFVNLPAMGANPMHKDIFVQTDYMVASDHSHKPDLTAIAKIVQAFADAPVSNPDGRMGITLHVDCGPNCVMDPTTGKVWGSLSRANPLLHADPLSGDISILGGPDSSGRYDWSAFNTIKSEPVCPRISQQSSSGPCFPAERAPIFHYSIFAHQYFDPNQTGDPVNCSSGISLMPGADFIISLGGVDGQGGFCWKDDIGSTWQQAGSFMHELGHNLGLNHGGATADGINYKPNYLSVMNYLFQTSGLLQLQPNTRNTVPGFFDYSRFSSSIIPPLNEGRLDESVGLNGGSILQNYGTAYWGVGPSCLGSLLNPTRTTPVLNSNINGPIDWNCDGAIETAIAAEINDDGSGAPPEILNTFDDWSSLVYQYPGGAIGQLGAALVPPSPPSTTPVEEITFQEDSVITKVFGVLVSGAGIFSASPGGTVIVKYGVVNVGTNTDTYSMSANSSVPWADFSKVPPVVTLSPHSSVQISIAVNIPLSANTASNAQIGLTAVSQASSTVTDRAEATITVVESPDTLPPTTTAAVAPQPNASGWNNANVAITLNSTDNEPGGTGVKQITYSATGAQTIASTNVSGSSTSFTISTEGITTITFFGTDNAGNVETVNTLTIKLDKTPPSIAASRTPAPNANGWNNTNVTVSFTCADGLSGLAAGSPPAPTILSREGAGQSVSGTCTDLAGNSATSTVSGINVDKTPPAITASANPSTLWPPNGKMVNVTVSGSITDAISGVNPNSAHFAVVDKYGSVQPSANVTLAANGMYSFTISLQASRLGTDQNGRTYTITVTAQDNAGNQSSASTAVVVPHDQGR